MASRNTWGDPGNRTEAEAIGALRSHIRLLRHYRKCAFEEGDYDYLGEIACKLRLLTGTDGGRPLLLDLIARRGFDDSFPVEILFRILPGERPKGDPTLRKYLTQYSAMEGIVAGARPPRWRKTNAELISEWANKRGAAHEDPTTPDWLLSAFQTPMLSDDPPAHVQWLKEVTDVVLQVSDRFLRTLEGIVLPSAPGLPERPHAAALRVRLFLANYVEPRSILLEEFGGIVSDRIYASGIGLDVIESRPLIIGVGAIVDVASDAFDTEHRLLFRLVNVRGEQITGGEPPVAVALAFRFSVPRPPDATPITKRTVLKARNLQLPALPAGDYSIRAVLDGTLTDEVFFSVRPRSVPGHIEAPTNTQVTPPH